MLGESGPEPKLGQHHTRARGCGLATLLLGLSLSLLSPAWAGEPATPAPERGRAASVRIVSPSASEVPWGPTLVRAAVTPPPGRKVLHVEIFAESALIVRDPIAPYEARWNAGDSLASRVIRVVALFDDGSRAEDLITTRGLAFRDHALVEADPIEHVELLASVTNEEGLPVTGLSAADFVVRDGGRAVRIERAAPLAERVDLPLSVTLLVDRSGSMRVHMERIARAGVALVGAMRPVDQVRISAFSEEMVVLQDFTRDPRSLLDSLDRVGPAGGGTRLFRAVHDTVRDMRDRPGRKAIVILTDGLDTDFTSPSSPITVNMYPILKEVAAAASRAGVTVVVILPGPTGRGYIAIQDLALQTGGWWSYTGDDFAETVTRLGERLLAGYVVEYDVARPGDPDRKRPVEVSLAKGPAAGWEVRAAMGAYAGLDLFEALAADLSDGTTTQRARAAREIGYFPGEEALALLRDTLDDEEPEVRTAAIASLSERRDAASMEEILGMLGEPDARVRAAAYEGAVRYGKAAVPSLAKLARERGDARDAALLALGSIGGDEAIGVLVERLGDSSCEVRSEAAAAAGLVLRTVTAGAPEWSPESPSLERLRSALGKLLDDECAVAVESARAAVRRTTQ